MIFFYKTIIIFETHIHSLFLMSDLDFDKYLENFPFFEVTEHGKVKCKYTHHDIPANISAIEEYMKTKKFQAAKQTYY